MKKLITAIAIALFAAGAAADDVYRGLAKGSPDLNEPHGDRAIGVQPGVGDSAAIYGRSGAGNPALFPAMRLGGADTQSSGWTRDTYTGFCGGNSELNC